MKPNRRLLAVLGAVLVAATLSAVNAQEGPYPSRNVTVIYPYAMSAAWDPMYRAVMQGIGDRIGKPVVFESRAGAGGAVGLGATARSRPDGYTLVLTNGAPLVILPTIQKDLQYDPLKDFTPIAMIGRGESYIIAGPALKQQTFAELIAEAKRAPGTISYAVLGSAHKLGLAKIEAATGAKFLQVPYAGTVQAETALLGGHVMISSNSGEPKVLEKGGLIRLLASTSPQRSAKLPNLPAIGETIPGFDQRVWHGFLGPAGMPIDRVDMLYKAIQTTMATPAIREMMDKAGLVAEDQPPARFAETLRTDFNSNAELVKKYNIQ
jgi:tripartite-type tricarboxylate transporter receptor subunit TctC